MKTSLNAPTVAEARRIDDFRLVGCIACWMLGHPETPYDVQHFLSGTHRISHGATCPLCPAHHRGVDFSPSHHLVSFARQPRTFHRVFGEDQELINLTDRVIAIEKVKRGLMPYSAIANSIDALPEAERLISRE